MDAAPDGKKKCSVGTVYSNRSQAAVEAEAAAETEAAATAGVPVPETGVGAGACRAPESVTSILGT
eukprot:CAMPEP_0172366298 /NCGR_PEP_ID=MMETSP1060-20121228/14748_1 /TAXON_ID=37318 /ORGANISM="Pseudo-nitzschia pungens, Strain cf. cingulata" /LENGTH=65 /DNA_ID=CAMNT_0013090099 /DNA_START=151 /DNA_END=344 /DNA_ORIENTATION=-